MGWGRGGGGAAEDRLEEKEERPLPPATAAAASAAFTKTIAPRQKKEEEEEKEINAKLGDFGLVHLIGAAGECVKCGTEMYLPPESLIEQQTSVSEPRYGVEGDLWSLGVLFYELWFGDNPVDTWAQLTRFSVLPTRPAPQPIVSVFVPRGARGPKISPQLLAIIRQKGWPPKSFFGVAPMAEVEIWRRLGGQLPFDPETKTLALEQSTQQILKRRGGQDEGFSRFYGPIVFKEMCACIDRLMTYDFSRRRVNLEPLLKAVPLQSSCPVMPRQILVYTPPTGPGGDSWVNNIAGASDVLKKLMWNIAERLHCRDPKTWPQGLEPTQQVVIMWMAARVLGIDFPILAHFKPIAEETERRILNTLDFNLVAPPPCYVPRVYPGATPRPVGVPVPVPAPSGGAALGRRVVAAARARYNDDEEEEGAASSRHYLRRSARIAKLRP